MAGFIVDNNVESTVADNPLAQAAVTLNVAGGEGANFPSTFPFRLTIWDDNAYPDPGDDSGMEIVECTARTVDALTIARGKEGTGDVAHANGERVALLITAGLFNDSTYGLQNISLLRESGDIASFSEKSTPVDADLVIIEDSADSNIKKKVQVGNLPSGQEIVASTYIVAATIANGCEDPNRADQQCDGTADQSEINTVITALPT